MIHSRLSTIGTFLRLLYLRIGFLSFTETIVPLTFQYCLKNLYTRQNLLLELVNIQIYVYQAENLSTSLHKRTYKFQCK